MSFPRVGIIGAGQLGRMLALAGYPLGIECIFVDRHVDSPGGQVAKIIAAPLDDVVAIESLARQVDVLTFDIENVSIEVLREMQSLVPVHPSPAAVGASQDRLSEKMLFSSLGIPTAPYVAINATESLAEAETQLGWPIVLKSRRLGYDGRGQHVAHSRDELTAAWTALGQVPAIAESFVRFDRELSLISVRAVDGCRASYPLTENVHANGILRTSVAPFLDTRLQAIADSWIEKLMLKFDYVGVLTVEFFELGGELLANEMAPRVHNSGHWTIEGAQCSQFENHLRAIAGLPLGSTAARGHSAMVNLLGHIPDRSGLIGIEGVHLHDYGKAARPGRKLGHCTMTDMDRDRLMSSLQSLTEKLAETGT
jgi:5-(carboxyamino)imidazole ribonucleotide synthase